MKKIFLVNLLLTATITLCPACTGTPVRYYASDACLIKKGETTQKEVLSLLGKPNSIEGRPDGLESWYYYNVKETLVRKLPYVGEKLAKKKIETLKIEFKGGTVSGCYYTVEEET